jgi:hypothetical protein
MSFGLLRLVFAALWMLAAWFFYYQGHLAPARQNAGWFGPTSYDLMAGFAVLMAVWNLVRWYLGLRRPTATPENPLSRRTPTSPRQDREPEYHPEFDFTRPPPGPER